MNARSYLDWCRLAGLYLDCESHFARYRAYAGKISPCGLTTAIAAEFLEDVPAPLNLQEWRNYCVYERGAEAQSRVAQTAAALDAIGARRAADRLRTLQSTSPLDQLMANFDKPEQLSPEKIMEAMKDIKLGDLMKDFRAHVCHLVPGQGQAKQPGPVDADAETREQIEHLLEQYVARHEAELQADIDKHGDPRTAPGFTPEARMQELERQRQLRYVADQQQEDLRQLKALMDKIDRQLQKGTPPRRLAPVRRQFLECYRRNRDRADDELTAAMGKMLERAAGFIAEHQELFRPQPVKDAQLLERLAALGEYDVELDKKRANVRWDAPKGLDCSWTRCRLNLDFPADDADALRKMLDAVERLMQRFATVTDEWRGQLIEFFRMRSGMMSEDELEDYDLDEAGEATEESILRHVGNANIHLFAEPHNSYIATQAHFGVDWDEEHGFEVGWEDEAPEPAPPAAAKASPGFSCAHVQFSQTGPALTREQIAAFEERFGVRLPDYFCQFLLTHNGGVPLPNHLPIKNQGMVVPADIERFYSLKGAAADADSLEAATQRWRDQSLAPELLPIAELRMADVRPGSAAGVLLLVLSGKKAGQLLVFQAAALELPLVGASQALAMQLPMFLEMCMVAARSLDGLFAKLTTRPVEQVPDWVKHIQAGRTGELLGWLNSGGNLSESFHGYGQLMPMTVIDHLARAAAPAMLQELVAAGVLKPKQLRASWEQYDGMNVGRFAELMTVLPKSMWLPVLNSPTVWDHPQLLEQLAAAGVDFNAPVNEEGMLPLHMAVQYGHKEGVRWLLAHGADVHKADQYGRNAEMYAENGPGYECLPLLQGKPENPVPPRAPRPDVPGIAALGQAAQAMPEGEDILVSIQIKTPPVTRIEKAYYRDECHYRLSIFLKGDKVVFNDMNSGRQAYLYAGAWPAFLFTPVLEWPELTPLWPTLEVREFNWAKAAKKRNYEGAARPDLVDHARSALAQAFDAEEAAARGIRLRK